MAFWRQLTPERASLIAPSLQPVSLSTKIRENPYKKGVGIKIRCWRSIDREKIERSTSQETQKTKMAFISSPFFNCILLFCFLGMAASSSVSLSDGIFESKGGPGRALLQTKKSCSVDFENQNYTILTSQCKGPQYPANLCCAAFKQFACPFADQINDLTTDCASTMFSYINLYGKYPPGLFANECKEGKEGLDCSAVTAVPPAATSSKYSDNESDAQKLMTRATWVIAGSFIALLFHLLG